MNVIDTIVDDLKGRIEYLEKKGFKNNGHGIYILDMICFPSEVLNYADEVWQSEVVQRIDEWLDEKHNHRVIKFIPVERELPKTKNTQGFEVSEDLFLALDESKKYLYKRIIEGYYVVQGTQKYFVARFNNLPIDGVTHFAYIPELPTKMP